MGIQETKEIDELVSNVKSAEDTLSDKAAEAASDESFLGEPATATINNVITDGLQDDTVVKFILTLPNEKQGHISFSEYEWERGHAETFVEQQLHSSINDLEDAIFHDIPVTYTNLKGWVTFAGYDVSSVHFGTSRFWEIDPDTGFATGKRITKVFTAIPLFAGLVIGFLSNSYTPLIFGFLLWVFLGYCKVAWAGMSSPRRKTIQTK
jgi:hypothetical protein